jgi:hypothetical protein
LVASLKPTARKFAQKAFGELEPKVVEKKAERFGPARWESAGGDMFLLREPMLSPEEWCLLDEIHHVTDLPETKRLYRAFQNDSRVEPLLGRLVGTALMSTLVDEEALARRVLWAVMRASNGSLRFSADAFDRGFDNWLAELVARTQEGLVLTPLSLRLDGRLDLGDEMEIVQLTDEEVIACLHMGAIRLAIPPAGSGTAWVHNRTAIRVAYQLPRGPSENFSDEDRRAASAIESEAFGRADEVVEALRVFESGHVAPPGRVLLRGEGSMQGGASAQPQVPHADELVLSKPEAFRDFWDLFRAARPNSAISVVTRRFSYAGERTRRDDEIVDLIAALEALLLSDIPERGELRFRTALRGALFIDGGGLTRQQIQKQLRRGYDVRSAVAHGAAPTTAHLKSPTDEALMLAEFVDGIEELVRLAVRKAVEAVGAGKPWPPDWDALTLEGATYP